MKIKDILYKTPEMSEQKLLKLIDIHMYFISKNTINKLKEIYKFIDNNELSQRILNEWDLIQDKKSLLSRSQRNEILVCVSLSLAKMTNG